MFGIDTVVMLLGYGVSSIIDLAFHIWVMVILVIGIKAHKKLIALPKEDQVIEGEFTELSVDDSPAEIAEQSEDSTEQQKSFR